MGWLRKKGRQLDRRIRKIFGKNAWLKVALLVAGGYMYGTSGGIGGGGAGGTSSTIGSELASLGAKGGNIASSASASAGTTAAGTGGFKAFMAKMGNGIKDFFWNKGPTDAVTGKVARGSPSWAGNVAVNIGSNVALGMAQQSMQSLQGQQAGFAPQENSAVNKAVMASNAAYGANGSILDAYRNFDFGPASTTMLVESARNRNISRNYIS